MEIPKKYNFSFLQEKSISELNFDFEKNFSKKSNKSILMPPPNITGNLHLGHTLNLVIQDFLNRFLILQGESVRWISGLDHSGIATQAKIESFGSQIGKNSAEKVKFVWNSWYPQQKEKFISQWKNLSLLLDYKQENFTFDKLSEEKVNHYFSVLYKDGLIYQKEKMINWDRKLMTAVSDIEVEQVEKKTILFYIDYSVHGSEFDKITVATTRPETIFADVALFFNPEDSRYLSYKGKFVVNPLNGSKIPILASESVKKDFGTGVLKCTPLHDFKDYELALKNNLPLVSCYDKEGFYNDLAGSWKGREIGSVFPEIIEYLEKNGYLLKRESYLKKFSVSQRSGCNIEPVLSLQWFLDLPKMIKEIEKKNPHFISKTKFYPSDFYEKVYYWRNVAHEWCISRQLWWGHQIPIWKDKKGNFFTSQEKEGIGFLLDRDKNVLDTWFSSGLWPLIVNSDENFNFKTIEFLITGSDLIFFWLFKMIVFTNYFSNLPPFKKVFFHGLIKDSNGKKMSKSFNNGIEPEQVISEYGSDALRLYILSDNSMGSDFFFNLNKIKGYYFFLQKLWSIFNFIISNSDKLERFEVLSFKKVEKVVSEGSNKFNKVMNFWILDEIDSLKDTCIKFSSSLETHFYSKELIHFTKEKFSNFYIHLLKNDFDASSFLTLLYVFQQLLLMFNPFIPLLTGYAYRKVTNDSFIMDSKLVSVKKITKEGLQNKDSIFDFVSAVKNKIFSFSKVSAVKKIEFFFELSENFKYKVNREIIDKVFSVLRIRDSINITLNSPRDKVGMKLVDVFPYGLLVFKDSFFTEKNSSNETLEFYNFEIERAKSLLQNEGFLKKSPSNLVSIEKEKLEKFIKQKKQFLSSIENSGKKGKLENE